MKNRRAIRKGVNLLALGLSGVATAIGLFFLGAILWTLIKNGVAGLTPAVFSAMTPPPGSSGGLLNAIYGSAVMTLIGILIGGPVGMLAGTYLAEYGRASYLSSVIRFVNDVLLSAPSIIIGLFVYELMVVRMGHFSAARSGVVTGLLLAVARISGETAPLLFTALNNQFWSTNLLAPMANLPVVIFQFALSPYPNWQQLAWSGALLITGSILILSIIARVVVARLNPAGRR